MRLSPQWMLLAAGCSLLTLTATVANADDATTPGRMRNGTTLQSIGIEWDIQGDANHNATCAVAYRKAGEGDWREAMPMVRIDADVQSKYANSDRHYNMLAGSIFFLEPGTTYEVQLELDDPDGGSTTETVELKTWDPPRLPEDGQVWHVQPGDGGGDGSQDNPFRGIPAAHAAAEPGDIVLLHAGDYGDVNIDKAGEPGKHIVWRAAGDGAAIIHRLTTASWNWYDGLDFRRDVSPEALAGGISYKRGLRAAWEETQGVYVTRCSFQDYIHAISMDRNCSRWYIADNEITGHKEGPAVLAGDNYKIGEGVELKHSFDCVVAYNRIQKVADGVSYPLRNCDIYGNEIFDSSDDGIEGDYGYANVRMWENRIADVGHYSVSFQPQFTGPWYFFRNQVEQPFKHFVVQQWFCVHNTMPEKVVPGASYEHAEHVVYINNRRVSSGELAEAQTTPLTLSEGSPAIDAGEVLPNINDPYVTDGKPDLGAYEHGQPVPHVGPRDDAFLDELYGS